METPSPLKLPTIGRTVIATITDDQGRLIERPAVVVRVWNEANPQATCLNAQVFCDGDGTARQNDGLPNVVWKTSLDFEPKGGRPHTWRWP